MSEFYRQYSVVGFNNTPFHVVGTWEARCETLARYLGFAKGEFFLVPASSLVASPIKF